MHGLLYWVTEAIDNCTSVEGCGLGVDGCEYGEGDSEHGEGWQNECGIWGEFLKSGIECVWKLIWFVVG